MPTLDQSLAGDDPPPTEVAPTSTSTSGLEPTMRMFELGVAMITFAVAVLLSALR